jgi:GxxExxY protein
VESVQRDRDPETYALLGAAMEAHSELGQGFLEAVYQEAFLWEQQVRQIPFEREVALPVQYKGNRLACSYRADFVCYGTVLIELKALERLTGSEMGQVINYLKATGLKKALLLNFGRPRLEYRRIVL